MIVIFLLCLFTDTFVCLFELVVGSSVTCYVWSLQNCIASTASRGGYPISADGTASLKAVRTDCL